MELQQALKKIAADQQQDAAPEGKSDDNGNGGKQAEPSRPVYRVEFPIADAELAEHAAENLKAVNASY